MLSARFVVLGNQQMQAPLTDHEFSHPQGQRILLFHPAVKAAFADNWKPFAAVCGSSSWARAMYQRKPVLEMLAAEQADNNVSSSAGSSNGNNRQTTPSRLTTRIFVLARFDL
jgi:hypothetical protein